MIVYACVYISIYILPLDACSWPEEEWGSHLKCTSFENKLSVKCVPGNIPTMTWLLGEVQLIGTRTVQLPGSETGGTDRWPWFHKERRHAHPEDAGQILGEFLECTRRWAGCTVWRRKQVLPGKGRCQHWGRWPGEVTRAPWLSRINRSRLCIFWKNYEQHPFQSSGVFKPSNICWP